MTRFLWNDKDVTGELPESPGLSELLEYLDRVTADTHVVVKDIRLDGESISLDGFKPEEYPAEKLSGTEEVRVLTIQATDLLCQSIDGFVTYLQRITEPLDKLVADCRARPDQQVFQSLKDLLESFSDMMRLLHSVEKLGHLSLAEIELDGRPVTESLNDFTEIVEEVVRCQESGDYPTLADLLQYEVKPNIIQFQVLLKNVRQQLVES